MGYMIEPVCFTDEKYRQLSRNARLMWVTLLTGPMRRHVPGLYRNVSPLTLADMMDDYTPDESVACVGEMITLEMVEWDRSAKVLRIPNAPRYNRCPNPNVLFAWYRAWSEFPHCDALKRHVTSLRDAVDFDQCDAKGRHSMAERWAETFGIVEAHLATTGELPNAAALLYPRARMRRSAQQRADLDRDLDLKDRDHDRTVPAKAGNGSRNRSDNGYNPGVQPGTQLQLVTPNSRNSEGSDENDGARGGNRSGNGSSNGSGADHGAGEVDTGDRRSGEVAQDPVPAPRRRRFPPGLG